MKAYTEEIYLDEELEEFKRNRCKNAVLLSLPWLIAIVYAYTCFEVANFKLLGKDTLNGSQRVIKYVYYNLD